jgi:hypothetical protein
MFTFDGNDRLRQSKILLANPQKKYIGLLPYVRNLKLSIKLNAMSEASFKIYSIADGNKNEFYEKIIVKRLIEIQYVGWFQIKTVEEGSLGGIEYKQITCVSLENELVGKKITNIKGVYSLYDVTDQEYSLMHLIADASGWGIGHIDNELLTSKRTFSIDTQNIYGLLMTDLSKSFSCIFQFNTFDKTINAYKLENIGRMTNVTLSRKNLVQEYVRESDLNKVVTKLKVIGDSSIDIKDVNPTGTDYIINLDFFTDSEWMTEDLVQALNNYKIKYNSYLNNYNDTLDLLKIQFEYLTTLKSELNTLEEQLKTYSDLQGELVSKYSSTPPVGSGDYSLYQTTLTNIDNVNIQISLKKTEISAKENEISSIKNSISAVNVDLDINNNFTADQIKELNTFITEYDEYQDSSFVITDDMSEAEALQMKRELFNNGLSELAHASKPQYSIEINASNLYTIQDEIDNRISYKEWREDFECGNIITLILRSGYYTMLRLIQLDIDFDNPRDMGLTFSDRPVQDDVRLQLGDLLAEASRASTSLSLAKFGYDKAANQTNKVREFMNGALNATTNAMINNDNQDLLIDTYGQRMRKWLPDQNKFDERMAWWNNNTLLFSDDGFKSSKVGIGTFTSENGEKIFAVMADVIAGNMVLTQYLNITNENNSITMNKDGATFKDCDITITRGNSKLLLNATDGIKLTNNGVNQFYIDSSGNATFAGKITGGSMNINGRFIVDAYGNLTANGASFTNGSFSGSITAVGQNGIISIDNGHILYEGYNGDNIFIDSGAIGLNSQYGNTVVASTGISTNNVTTNLINGNTPITSANIGQQTVLNAANANIAESANWAGNAGNATYAMQSGNASWASMAYGLGNSPSDGLAVYVSANNNFRPYNNGMSSCGTSGGLWSSIWANSGTINTSDARKKNSIQDLDERYTVLFDNIKPRMYKMNDSSSDRFHIGVIAQETEQAMKTAGITSQEFAGLVKDPVYSKKLLDPEGNETPDYDTTSEIVDYNYFLRYNEFIPLLINEVQMLKQEIINLKSAS